MIQRVRFSIALLSAALCLALTTPGYAASGSKEQAAKFYESAVKLVDKADYDGALIELKNALQQDPKMVAALVLMGETYVASGQGAAAETSLNEAAKAGADISLTVVPHAKALVMQFKHARVLAEPMPAGLPLLKRSELLEVKAQAALQSNQKEALQKILAEVDAIDPNSITDLTIKATLAMRNGELDEAQKLVDKASNLTTDNVLVWLTRASLHHVQDRTDEALSDYAKVLELDPKNDDARLARVGLLLDLGRDKDTDADFAHFANATHIDPRLAYLNAIKLSRAGDEKAAQAALTDAANTIETLGGEIVMHNVQLMLVGGIANFSLGKVEAAKLYLQEYVKTASGEVETRKMLASVLIKQQEFRQAATLLEDTVKNAGESPELLALLATAYSGLGDHPRATAVLERAVTLQPKSTKLATDLALSRAQRGQTEAALAELATVFTRDDFAQTAGQPLAILYLTHHEYAKAEEVARKLVEKNPKDLTLLNMLGVAQFGLGKLMEARVTFEKALAKDPNYRPADVNLGKIDRTEGKFPEAEKRFNALLAKKPTDAQMMLELARTQAARGDQKAALKWARDAVKAEPKSFEMARYLAGLLVADGKFDEANNLILGQAQAHPDNLFIMETQANILAAQGKRDEMRPILKRMVDSANFDVEWLLKTSAMQINAGLLPDAQYALYKAIQEQPNNAVARARLSGVELALGHLNTAEELATKLVADFPANPSGQALLGDVAVARGKHAEAAEHFRVASEGVVGGQPDWVLKRHLALRSAGDNPGAEKILKDWLGSHPKDLWATGALAEHYLQAGNYAAANTLFEEFLSAAPEHAPTLNNMANLQLKLKDYKRAQTYAEHAYKLQPQDPLINDTLGWTLLNLGDTDNGLRYLREARARAANVPEIRYHLAVALQRLGRNKEALIELNEAFKITQEFDGKADALKLQTELKG